MRTIKKGCTRNPQRLEAFLSMQYSAHVPNRYLLTHQDRLLPDWSLPVQSVLLVFQPSQCYSIIRTRSSEAGKNQLRQQFFEFVMPIAEQLLLLGYLVDVFDPQTGLPLLSTAGSLSLDDVAIAHAILGYPINKFSGCCVVQHPTWGNAVYPSTLVSTAPSAVLQQVADTVANTVNI